MVWEAWYFYMKFYILYERKISAKAYIPDGFFFCERGSIYVYLHSKSIKLCTKHYSIFVKSFFKFT